jgi:hypothetical protein
LERPPHSLQRSQLISERSQRHEGDRLGPPIADLDGDARYWLDRSRLDQPCLCAASQLPSNHPMKFVERRPFANPDLAARKLIEIANSVEPAQDGRIYIERVNAPFLVAGGIGDDFRAGIERAIALGWLSRHESGTYLKITEAGAALFA